VWSPGARERSRAPGAGLETYMHSSRFACILATTALLAGCGGSDDPPSAAKATATPASTETPAPTPAFTRTNDIAACAQLEQAVQAVSQLIGHTTEGITQATNPKELASRVGTAQKSLLDSANLVEIVIPPEPLEASQKNFVKGLRMFAADFGRGKKSAAKGDMATATQQLTDETAMHKIQVAAKKIDDMCGA
jgi:hypothetical protein